MRNSLGVAQGALVASDLIAAGEAGGYITQIDIHPDGTKLICGDVLPPLWCNNTDVKWKQTMFGTQQPAGWAARVSANNSAGRRDDTGSTGAVVARDNSSKWYFAQEACIFIVTGYGTTVTLSPQSSYTSRANSQEPRIAGPYLAAHPTDGNRVMWGVQEGLVFTTNGFTADTPLTAGVPATTVPASTGAPRMVCVAFDPSNVNVAYAHSWGNGLYKSTNAMTATPTFTLVSGFAAKVVRLRVGPDGRVWATDDAGNLWRYDGTSSVQLTTPPRTWHDVAIDLANANRIIIFDGSAYCALSTDGGSTWTSIWYGGSPSPIGIMLNADDVPYIGGYPGGFDMGAVQFDPSSPNKIWTVQGLGVMWTNFPSSFQRMDWYSQSHGIRQLIPYSCLSPVGGKPLWSGQDRPIFIMRDNLDQKALNYGPRSSLTAGNPVINHGWHLQMSPQDNTYIIAQVIKDTNISGWSQDGGQTFTPFATQAVGGGYWGGCLAVSQNKDEIICAPASRLGYQYTRDRGNTWQPMTLPGFAAGSSAGQWSYFFLRQSMVADAVTPGTFMIFHPGLDAGDPGYDATHNRNLAGLFMITGGLGNAPVRLPIGNPFTDTGSGYGSMRLDNIPGRAGHYLLAADSGGGGQPMKRTRDSFATVENVPIYGCMTFAFGAPAPDSPYPTCWAVGFYNGVGGIHYSTDDLATWHTACVNSIGNDWCGMSYIGADRNEFGLIYVGISGKAWTYGRITDRKALV